MAADLASDGRIAFLWTLEEAVVMFAPTISCRPHGATQSSGVIKKSLIAESRRPTRSRQSDDVNAEVSIAMLRAVSIGRFRKLPVIQTTAAGRANFQGWPAAAQRRDGIAAAA
jgi:hypothetical protein